MREVLRDVFVVPADDNGGFGFSHFVRRRTGNVLLPRLKQVALTDQYAAINQHGGVSVLLLSDRHFAGPGCRAAADHFDAELVSSAIEAKAFAKRCPIDRPLEFEEQEVGPGIAAIPTPGHTPGQLAYRIEGDHETFLFVGDLAYRVGGAWQVGHRRRQTMAAALERLQHLTFDYFIGCAGYEAPDSFVAAQTTADLTEAILDACTR